MHISQSHENKFIILVLYADDILLVSKEFGLLYETKQVLLKTLEMKDFGKTSFILGMKFTDRSRGMLGLP